MGDKDVVESTGDGPCQCLDAITMDHEQIWLFPNEDWREPHDGAGERVVH